MAINDPLQQWPEQTLNDVCIKITDGAHLSPKSVENGLPMASVKDLTSFGINMESCRQIAKEDFDKLVGQGCQPLAGDVLIAKDGASALDTVCVMKTTLDLVLLSSVAILRPDKTQVISSFLYYYLDAETTRSYMKNAFTTGAAIPRVVLKDFKLVRIKIPSLPTQRKIAAILLSYDDLIENNLRRIRILEEMAQNLYREWFVKFRFPGHQHAHFADSTLGRIPEGWEVRQIKDVADVNARSVKKENTPVEITYVDIASVSSGCIDKMEIMAFTDAPSRARRITKHGDIIWSSVRPNRRSFSLVIDPPENLIVSTGFAVISAKEVPFTYLYHSTTTDDFVVYLVNHAKGSAYPAVNAEDFENADILVPSKPLLNTFDDIVLPITMFTNQLKIKNTILRRTRNLLLPRLISGEVDVSALDFTVPEEVNA